MNERSPFQYSILRYTHDVVTGEHINAGLAFYSKSQYFFRVQLLTRYQRLTQTFPGADGETFKRHMEYLQRVFDRISQDVASRQTTFLGNWPDTIEEILIGVIPPDDSSLKFSEPRTGMTDDLEGIFDHLYKRQVEYYLNAVDKASRTDQDIWQNFKKPLVEENIYNRLSRHVVQAGDDTFEFDYSWKNGAWNVLQPLSFDLAYATYMRKKAKEWLGSTIILGTANEVSHIYMLLGRPHRPSVELEHGYKDAKSILSKSVKGIEVKVELVEEDNAGDFAKHIKPMVEEHTED